MANLAVFYEHPQWFEPLFRELDHRGVDCVRISIQDHTFDPADPRAPAPVILNRLAMSSFLRQDEHALFYSLAALGHWEGLGARVVNGTRALAYDLSKARQLSLFRRLGLAIPRTRVAHRREDVPRLAAAIGYPVLVKGNVGGSGAGIIAYQSPGELEPAVADALTPVGVDGVALVQEYIPIRDARVIRCEVLEGKLLYAIALDVAGSTFDLCPADVCRVDRPIVTVERFVPPPQMVAAVEEVENLIASIKRGQRELASIRESVAASEKSLGLSREAMAGGTGILLTVLDAQRSLNRSPLALAQTHSQLSRYQLSLFVALGTNAVIDPADFEGPAPIAAFTPVWVRPQPAPDPAARAGSATASRRSDGGVRPARRAGVT